MDQFQNIPLNTDDDDGEAGAAEGGEYLDLKAATLAVILKEDPDFPDDIKSASHASEQIKINMNSGKVSQIASASTSTNSNSNQSPIKNNCGISSSDQRTSSTKNNESATINIESNHGQERQVYCSTVDEIKQSSKAWTTFICTLNSTGLSNVLLLLISFLLIAIVMKM